MRVGIYNDDGELLGFDHVYDDDPNDAQDRYDEWLERHPRDHDDESEDD